ncbi:MAG TPA: hypothetical protein VLH16_07050 [Bacteroidales bacterium]|nr:hypothetical protein [Bacteroidales bacterium]
MTANTTLISAYAWKTVVKPAIIDISALAFIYLLPTISHLIGIRLWWIEPMRLMLVLAMVHTHRKNAFILALTLPLFSFFISAHPVLLKSLLISAELVVNVVLFYLLLKRIHVFPAIFLSIWLSKVFYYGIKYLAMTSLLLDEDRLIGTPLMMQLLTSTVFSLYLFVMFRLSGKESKELF